jgi:hypothetical protein
MFTNRSREQEHSSKNEYRTLLLKNHFLLRKIRAQKVKVSLVFQTGKKYSKTDWDM